MLCKKEKISSDGVDTNRGKEVIMLWSSLKNISCIGLECKPANVVQYGVTLGSSAIWATNYKEIISNFEYAKEHLFSFKIFIICLSYLVGMLLGTVYIKTVM